APAGYPGHHRGTAPAQGHGRRRDPGGPAGPPRPGGSGRRRNRDRRLGPGWDPGPGRREPLPSPRAAGRQRSGRGVAAWPRRAAGRARRASRSVGLTGRRRRIGNVIDEAELRRLTEDERRQLARILAAIDRPHPLMDPRLRRRRRFGLMFMTACCVALACWIAILILTLPSRYTSSDWQGAWVGLDIAELAGFAATAWAAWHQRQIVIFFMIITGTLLVCDAWFDLALDYGSRDFTTSLVSALVVELPLAFLLFNSARRLVRVTIATTMQVSGVTGPVPPLWRVPLFADGLEECLPDRLRPGSTEAEARADVTAAGGPSSLGVRRSRGENRGHEPLHRVPPADVLDRLPDDRQRERRRGHRARGLPACQQGRRCHRSQGVPGHDHHPAGHRSPALGARPPRVLRRDLAPRAAYRKQRA